MEHTQDNDPGASVYDGTPGPAPAWLPQYGQQHPGGHTDPGQTFYRPSPVDQQRLLEGGPAKVVETPTDEYGQPDIHYAASLGQREPLAAPAEPAVEGQFVSRVDLPSGGWAEIADPRKIRAKHRKRVMDSLNVDRLRAGTAGVAFDMTDGLILMMVEKWHLPYLPDVARPLDNPASVDELEIPDYDRLTDALEPAQELLFPKPATVDGAKTPGSPTPPAGG